MSDGIEDADLHAFLDGELSPARERAVLEYVAADPEAKERLRAYAEQKLLLRAARYDTVASPLRTEALVDRLAAALRNSMVQRRVGLAAALVLSVAAGWTVRPAAERALGLTVPEFVREAAVAHDAFADQKVLPLEVAGPQGERLEAWAAAALRERVDIPELESLGWTLVGGRLVASEDGPIAQLYYQDKRGRRVSVSLATAEEQAPAMLEVAEVEGLEVGYWREGEVAYAVVGEPGQVQLAEIVDEIGTEPPSPAVP